MAAGVPVVANAVDGVPEAVADGQTGYMVSPGDLEGMSRKVLQLLEDPALAGRLGEEGSRRVMEFDADLMVRQQEDLYQELAEEHFRLETA
jgi:glycosyltransferase involved in cell wall biosynthesis